MGSGKGGMDRTMTMPGEPPSYDPNEYYRILESVDGKFYPQRKRLFRWKNYDLGKKYDFIVAKFDTLFEAKEFLLKKIEEQEERTARFQGNKFIIHKVF